MHRGILAFIAVVSRVVARIAILVSAAVVVEFAVAVETLALLTVTEITVAVVVTEVAAFAIVFATAFAPVVARFAKLCRAAFLTSRIFPAPLVAGFLRYNSNDSLLALLLFALAVVLVFFAFLAREEFLAFGFRAAA